MSAGYEPIDNYEVVNFIAGGSTSQVLEVIEPGTHRHLAMKLINDKHPDVKESKAVLKAEAAICKQLDHPNIVHYEGFTNGREHTYMLMEYFRAPTLKLQLKMDQQSVHLRLKKILEGLCAGLQHLHDRGYVHRDIKPENVLANKVGEVRLIDFSLTSRPKGGLAKLLGGKLASIQGTRTYIAPETIRKQPPVFQTDFYSLGILLFEVLTGKTPFQAPTPNELLQKHISATPPNASEFNSNVSPEMDRLILKLLSKKPDQRGKDMAEISAELRRVRIFKEEIPEVSEATTEEKPADLLEQLSASKLDSRLDAQRSEIVRQNPELAAKLMEQQQQRQVETDRKKKELAELKKKVERSKTPPAPAQAAPPPPQAPPAPYPYPYQMPPGYPMPGYPNMPGMPNMPGIPAMGMPGAPYSPPPPAATAQNPAGGYPPAVPAASSTNPAFSQPSKPASIPISSSSAGNPAQASRSVPPKTAPGQSPAPSAESTASPKPGQATPSSKAAPPAQQGKSAPPAQDEDLEFMTELPDIL